jgi:hypothetical protein
MRESEGVREARAHAPVLEHAEDIFYDAESDAFAVDRAVGQAVQAGEEAVVAAEGRAVQPVAAVQLGSRTSSWLQPSMAYLGSAWQRQRNYLDTLGQGLYQQWLWARQLGSSAYRIMLDGTRRSAVIAESQLRHVHAQAAALGSRAYASGRGALISARNHLPTPQQWAQARDAAAHAASDVARLSAQVTQRGIALGAQAAREAGRQVGR